MEMAGKQNGSVADLTVEVLKDIRSELRQSNERLGRVETRLEAVDEGIGQLNERFDHLLQISGKRWQDHDRRIRVLESRAARRRPAR